MKSSLKTSLNSSNTRYATKLKSKSGLSFLPTFDNINKYLSMFHPQKIGNKSFKKG